MPAQIRPTRLDVNDRFPMLAFNIHTEGQPQRVEVVVATNPQLFTDKSQRNIGNFYSSRAQGPLPVPGGDAIYMLPPNVLTRFIGQERLYFGLATAPSNNGAKLEVSVSPHEDSPYVSIRALTGRSLRRVRMLPSRQERAAGYGGDGQKALEWAGDEAQPGTQPAKPTNGDAAPAANGGGSGVPSTSADPAAYDDGFGPMPDAGVPTPQATNGANGGNGKSAAAQGLGRPRNGAVSRAQDYNIVKPYYDPTTVGEAVGQLIDMIKRLGTWSAGVPRTDFAPHSAICHLVFPEGIGTGFYVSPDTILTAAHLLYGKTNGQVYVGRNGTSSLADFAIAEADWTLHPLYDGTHDNDIAVIRVSTPPPNGFYFELEDLAACREEPVVVCGYAAEGGLDPTKQHLDADHVREVSDNLEIIYYSLQTTGGTSGSPVFYATAYEDEARQQSVQSIRAFGVHVDLHSDRLNQGCRLSASKIAWIQGRGLVSVSQSLGRGRPRSGRARSVTMSASDPLSVEVKYRMFIPSPAIDAPTTVYGGDGRGFSYDQGTSRGEITAQVQLSAGGGVESISVQDRHWGESTAYATADTSHPDGKPDWWLEKTPGAQPTDRATLPADDDNLSIRVGSGSLTRNITATAEPASIVTIEAVGALPLAVTAPAIDADMSVLLRIANGSVEARVLGSHDGFPCHELYVNGQQLYAYDPIAAGNDPTALFPPMDIDADTAWTKVADMSSMEQAQALTLSYLADSPATRRARKTARALGSDDFTLNWDEVQSLAQPTDVSCWATAGAMLIGWRDQVSISPESIAEIGGRTTATGLDPAQVGQFADELGLVAEPPQCYTIDGFRQLLETKGPLWVGASVPGLHAIVVTGMYQADGQIYVRITDPWDREVGSPGSPGPYADTHATGSRYILKWEDFVTEYEAAATDYAQVNLQILDSGSTGLRQPNRGPDIPAGYAMSLSRSRATSRARAKALGTVVPSYDPRDPRGILTQILDFFGRFGEWSTGVDMTRAMPHSAICQLQITLADGSLAGGTGFYAGPGLIATCAHCLVDATSVRVFAGRTDGDFLTMFDVDPADWTIHPHFAATDDPYDIGVIRVQWAGGMAPNGNYFELQDLQGGVGSKVIVSGYAGDNVNINRQHMDGTTIHELSPDGHHVFYNLQTSGGESGAPVLALLTDTDTDGWADAVRVVGIHVDAHSPTRNMGVRLTPEKISWILNRGMVAPAAMSLGARPCPPAPPARTQGAARAFDANAPLSPARRVEVSDRNGVHYELEQADGMRSPRTQPAVQMPPMPARVAVEDWPRMPEGAGGACAGVAIAWSYAGGSVGDVRVTPTEAAAADGWQLAVTGRLIDGPDEETRAAMTVDLNYCFRRGRDEEHAASVRVVLRGDGSHERTNQWLPVLAPVH